MTGSVWTPLFAALIGAVSAGGIQFWLQARQRKLEKRSVLVALISEIASICHLVRSLRYEEWVNDMLSDTLKNPHQFRQPEVYLGSDYFAVFHGSVSKLGYLSEEDSREIVKFYGLCKLAADCADQAGVTYEHDQRDEAIKNLRVIQSSLGEMLKLGDALVQRTNPK